MSRRGCSVIKKINDCQEIIRHNKTGIVFVDDGKTGCIHSHHAAIDSNGSVIGMKRRGFWGRNDFIKFNVVGMSVNISSSCCTSSFGLVTRILCNCPECRNDKKNYMRDISLNKEESNIVVVKCLSDIEKKALLYIHTDYSGEKDIKPFIKKCFLSKFFEEE